MELDYEAMYQKNPHALRKMHLCIRDLLEFLDPNDSLLDAGCCEGHLYENLTHSNYTGIDIVPRNIEAAKARLPGVRFEVGDILKLHEKGEKWDIVFCSRVLMHLPNYEQNVESLRKIARKKLIVTIPMRGSFTDIEKHNVGKTGVVQFRSFSGEELKNPPPEKIIKHDFYSTVVYPPHG